MDLSKTWNADYVDSQYTLWLNDPEAVSQEWRFFFEGFELGGTDGARSAAVSDPDLARRLSGAEALVYRYRELGHLLACLDPLTACPVEHPLLSLSAFGLTEQDLDISVQTRHFHRNTPILLQDIVRILKSTYCRSVGVEYMHLQDPAERFWLQQRMEPVQNQPDFSPETQVRIMEKLCRATFFESFLHKKYIAQTRFSLEGAEVIIPMLDALFDSAGRLDCREIVLGMSHRGRLNVQAHILGKPYAEIFDEFSSCYAPEQLVGAGDVKYHNGYLADVPTTDGRSLKVLLANNPSHLETVNPVVEGIARARQDMLPGTERFHVLPLLIHGDAAFAGQGIVAETLNLSQLEGYRTGGTVHIVINNQIGYTTLPENARSTRYSTDVAKMLMVPIFHVHGENPEAVLHVANLACEYRRTFAKDVVIDVICYRRYGHNEGDDPYFTQPLMYDRIKNRPSLYELYSQQLVDDRIITPEQRDSIEQSIQNRLDDAFQSSQKAACPFPASRFYANWKGYHGNYTHRPAATSVKQNMLKKLADALNQVPEAFSINPKLQRILAKRQANIDKGSGIDWASAEALAFATILLDGIPVRLSGQDSGRGTFSQRHSVVFDVKSGEPYIPLNHLGLPQAGFFVYNSMLSEAGVLGFEYGYSLVQPEALILWEAQFGDFANNAQSIIDLYIASGEIKWQRLSGLVLLLPHGYEGLGPEHSSARLERFLQLCAENNLQVCNPTTPAQYFHLLRRQVKRNLRKPLVVMTPKGLLRHPRAASSLDELAGGRFNEIIDDPKGIAKPHRVILCSGKIFYELIERRASRSADDTVIIRIEQLYPFPEKQLFSILKKYDNAALWRWVQEEPRNMGGWEFIRPRLAKLLGQSVEYAGRDASATTATGFPGRYKEQQEELLEAAFQ